MKCPKCGHELYLTTNFPVPRAFQAWKLRYCDKMELAEVAERMGITYGTVLLHLKNFRKWCPQVAPNQSDLKKEKKFSFDENRDTSISQQVSL